MFMVLVGTINNSDFNEISNSWLFRLIKDVCIAFSRQASFFWSGSFASNALAEFVVIVRAWRRLRSFIQSDIWTSLDGEAL